jgi:hypothetical protein
MAGYLNSMGARPGVAHSASSSLPRMSASWRAVFKPYIDGGIARAAIAMVPVEFSLHHG